MKFITLILGIFLIACSKKSPTYIQGYVYNEQKEPVEGIRIEDPDNKNIFSITNLHGYFRINRMINGKYLYVILKEKTIDSVYVVRTHPERGASYNFVEGRKDTLFITMKEQKIISQ